MKIAYLEPFYGGSHKMFVDGLVHKSRHHIDLYTLPDRFWKWRTRGAALEFFKRLPDPSVYDLVVASDMVNLAELQGLWRKQVNTVLYMHENQLTYPLPQGTIRDANYIMTDLLSAFSAGRVVFNSHSHKEAFFNAASEFSAHIPDCKPAWILSTLKDKTRVLYPGIDLNNADIPENTQTPIDNSASPVLVWNHRWEYDKAPEDFRKVLQCLNRDKVSFKLILLGDRAESANPTLEHIQQECSGHLHYCGYAQSKREYYQLLSQGDIIISTAIQENYGISCIEAMHRGCFPLFPNRLSYPEIVPPELHQRCLYHNLEDLVVRIKNWIPPDRATQNNLHRWTNRFDWNQLINQYDDYFETPTL